MAQARKDARLLIQGDNARLALLKGSKFMYDSVVSSYGPKGVNTGVEKSFGYPMATRDGVTLSRETYTGERAENMGAQFLMQASEKTNKVAGDGTTATVALAYHLFAGGVKAIASGKHPMELKAQLMDDQALLLDKLKTLSKPIKTDQLKQVATVSSGDPLIGQLIAEAVEYVGDTGGINVEKAPLATIERVYQDGYFIQSGFETLQGGRKELHEPLTLVIHRRLTTHGDIVNLLNQAFETAKNKGLVKQGQVFQVVLIGNIEEQAYLTASNMIAQGLIEAILVKPPLSYGAMSQHLLEDIAIYAGCDPIIETTDLKTLSMDFLGQGLDRVVATKSETTLFGKDSSSEAVQDRIKQLKEQIAAEEVDQINERLKDRLAKLEGRIAIFRIGGATETAKEETEFRIEDAVLATRAASRHGVVPGGGITLLELSKTDALSELTCNALRSVFQQLLINANLRAEVKLDEVLKAKPGFGFNLRSNDELVNMVDAGILDPTLVVEQIVTNACEIAANMLAMGSLLIFVDAKEA